MSYIVQVKTWRGWKRSIFAKGAYQRLATARKAWNNAYFSGGNVWLRYDYRIKDTLSGKTYPILPKRKRT